MASRITVVIYERDVAMPSVPFFFARVTAVFSEFLADVLSVKFALPPFTNSRLQ